MSDVRDCWPDVKFTDFAPASSALHTSTAFERIGRHRWLAGVSAASVALKDGGELGTIVGHNDSANFEVAFDLDTLSRVDPQLPSGRP